MKLLKTCFDKNEINKGRQDELDIVKGLAIIFMVWCHTFDSLGGDRTTPIGFLVDCILGGPFAAPVFMICMGIGICYSRNNTPKEMAQRGLSIFLMGYFLNICRYTIPTLITYLISGDSTYLQTIIPQFFVVDILQFAGLSFLLIALLRKLNISMWWGLVFAGVLSVLGTLLIDKATGVTIIDYIFGLFWKTNENAYFTLFHWFAYPVVGCIFGQYLRRCVDKKVAYKFFLILFPIVGLLEIAIYFFGYGLAGDTVQYFYMNPVNIIFCTVLAAAWTGVWYLLRMRLPNMKIGYLQKLSRHINNVYCIHWVMIGIACIIREFTWKDSTFGLLPATLIAAVFLIASEWIADWYTNRKKAKKA